MVKIVKNPENGLLNNLNNLNDPVLSVLILLIICTFSALLKMTVLSEKRLSHLYTKSLRSSNPYTLMLHNICTSLKVTEVRGLKHGQPYLKPVLYLVFVTQHV
jgi:hypothetical protein